MSICMATISVVPKEDEDFFDLLGYNPRHAGKLFGGLLSTRDLPGRDDLYVKLWYFNTPVVDTELTIVLLLDESCDISPAHVQERDTHQEALTEIMVEIVILSIEPAVLARNQAAGIASRNYTMTDGNYIVHFADVSEEMFRDVVQFVPLNGNSVLDE